jgi:hypothetical protein
MGFEVFGPIAAASVRKSNGRITCYTVDCADAGKVEEAARQVVQGTLGCGALRCCREQ